MKHIGWIIGLIFIILLAVAEAAAEGFGGGRRGGHGGRRHGGRRWGRRGGRRWMGMGRGYGYGPGQNWSYGSTRWFPGFYGACKNGCTSTGNGTWGCQYPGVGRNDCIFATDCQWCGSGGGLW